MDFDYIIAGGGIAGAVCAYQLSKNHKQCLILEKTEQLTEKRCGGGVPYTAVSLLKNIGIDVGWLLSNGATAVHGHVFCYSGWKEVHTYRPGIYSIGTSRKVFDGFLIQNALQAGAVIKYGNTVSAIKRTESGVFVNGVSARKFVCAVGARGLNGNPPNGQTMGISAHIVGLSRLQPSRFYFWYPENRADSYFWAFPIGQELWNVGLWYQKPDSSMKQTFLEGIYRFIEPNFPNGFKYQLIPRGEFLGNIDQRMAYDFALDGIGDFAGYNNKKNGGGILYAIQSALQYAEKEMY